MLKREIYKMHTFLAIFFVLKMINDNVEFDKNYKDIYPSELELKKESISNSEPSFLDLSIKIEKKN